MFYQNLLLRWPYPERPEGWPEYDDRVDYCGPNNCRIVDKIVRRKIVGVDTNLCCWAHDCRYVMAETENQRRLADQCFWRDMKLCICARYPRRLDPRRFLALGIAWRRYEAVRLFGRSAWQSCKKQQPERK